MKLHRLFCWILLCCLCLSLIPGAQADAPDESLEQVIIDACVYRQEGDLSDFNLTSDQFREAFDRLFNDGRLPWYTSNDYQYTYDTETGILYSFAPEAQPNEDAALTAYEEKAAQILDACVLDGMSQWQIALSLHDYLIANCAYDSTLEKNLPYNMLVENTSVCAGYAQAYQDLLQRAGIDCRYVVSEPMEHAWNLVCIDGNWYHVDLTWDDPEPDTDGYVSHQYFLLTDEQIKGGEEPHYDWKTDITCTDTRFTDGFWKDVYSAICYETSDTCYLLRSEELLNRIYVRNDTTGEETLLYAEPSAYIDLGYGQYIYEHHGLTLREGRLWFSTMEKVMSVKTDGTDLKTHHENSGNTYIYGCHAGEDSLELTLCDHDGEESFKSVSLVPTDTHKCSFLRTVVKPTQEEDGYTLSQCSCGLTAKSVPTPALNRTKKTQTGLPLENWKERIATLMEGKIWIAVAAGLSVLSLAFIGRRRKK